MHIHLKQVAPGLNVTAPSGGTGPSRSGPMTHWNLTRSRCFLRGRRPRHCSSEQWQLHKRGSLLLPAHYPIQLNLPAAAATNHDRTTIQHGSQALETLVLNITFDSKSPCTPASESPTTPPKRRHGVMDVLLTVTCERPTARGTELRSSLRSLYRTSEPDMTKFFHRPTKRSLQGPHLEPTQRPSSLS